MHDGCSGIYATGEEVVSKIRMMGFNKNTLPRPLNLVCVSCKTNFDMTHMETSCPDCGMVYGVIPCHSHSPEHVKPAGINY